MKIWSIEEEARRLDERFFKVNQAKFARDHKVPGGASMLSQHIKGRRPINLDSANAYADGFGCTLDEISPRLAEEVRGAATRTNVGDSGLLSKSDDRRLQAGTPAQKVIDQLFFFAQHHALQDEDWLLLQAMAQRLAGSAQRQTDPQERPLEITAGAQETIDNRVREAQNRREQNQQQGHQPAKVRAT